MESTSLPLSPSTHTTYDLTQHTPPQQQPCPGQASLSLPLSGGSPDPQHHGAEVVDPYRSPCSPQISLAEYNAQAGDYTQQALRELKTSPDYKRHIQRCHRFDKLEEKND